jgi:hypothetical protein
MALPFAMGDKDGASFDVRTGVTLLQTLVHKGSIRYSKKFE